MPQVTVVIVQNGSQINTAVVPFTVPVPSGNQTITWTAAGADAVFPESSFFNWKTSPAPLSGSTPTRSSDGKTLTLSYNNNFSDTVWEYGIRIANSSSNVHIDPEIDNDPPNP